jgi:hypothetical protein
VAADGSNLPQGGGNDGAYWLDLPVDIGQRERVKKGDLAGAKAYVQAKPMLGGTATDLALGSSTRSTGRHVPRLAPSRSRWV